VWKNSSVDSYFTTNGTGWGVYWISSQGLADVLVELLAQKTYNVSGYVIVGYGEDAQVVLSDGTVLNVSCCQVFDNIYVYSDSVWFEVNGSVTVVYPQNDSKLSNYSYNGANVSYKMSGSFNVSTRLNASREFNVWKNSSVDSYFTTNGTGWGLYWISSQGLADVLVELLAQNTYNVSGYVFDDNGSAVENATVSYSGGSNTTDATGYYIITGVLNGTYDFTASKSGYDSSSVSVTVSGGDVAGQNFTITKLVYTNEMIYNKLLSLERENKVIGESILVAILIILGMVFLLAGLYSGNSIATLLSSMVFFVTMALPIPVFDSAGSAYFGIAATGVLFLFGLVALIITFYQWLLALRLRREKPEWGDAEIGYEFSRVSNQFK
jgi:hypothetical protein